MEYETNEHTYSLMVSDYRRQKTPVTPEAPKERCRPLGDGTMHWTDDSTGVISWFSLSELDYRTQPVVWDTKGQGPEISESGYIPKHRLYCNGRDHGLKALELQKSMVVGSHLPSQVTHLRFYAFILNKTLGRTFNKHIKYMLELTNCAVSSSAEATTTIFFNLIASWSTFWGCKPNALSSCWPRWTPLYGTFMLPSMQLLSYLLKH